MVKKHEEEDSKPVFVEKEDVVPPEPPPEPSPDVVPPEAPPVPEKPVALYDIEAKPEKLDFYLVYVKGSKTLVGELQPIPIESSGVPGFKYAARCLCKNDIGRLKHKSCSVMRRCTIEPDDANDLEERLCNWLVLGQSSDSKADHKALFQ